MSKTIAYKGFQIRAGCKAAGTAGRFKPTLVISRIHDGLSYTNDKAFSPPYPRDDYETEADAVEIALEVGRAIVDGRVAGHSVKDL
jgi:hypothetical protein